MSLLLQNYFLATVEDQLEAYISHLKFDYRLVRNHLKRSVGDSINLMMEAASFKFKKLMIRLQRLLRLLL